jgi:hypothetical protein
MKKIIVTESDKKEILSKHLKEFAVDIDDVVICDWLSPDEKYVIFLDELYDLENKTKLGDIWKKPDNIILFLEHSFRVSKFKKSIKEHAQKTFSNILLTENVQDLSEIKPLMKQFLSESKNAWDYFKDFVSNTAKETKTGVTNFVTDLGKGGYKLGSEILKGNWSEVWDLLKQGTKWVGRKIRQAVYSPVGIIIDTILIATEIGKVPQAIIWGIVVLVDIYEFVTGDYEHKDEPMWLRIAFFLIDILGFVTAGVAAKTARAGLKAAISGGRGIEGFGNAIAKNPTFRELITNALKGLKDLPSKLASLTSTLGKGYFGKLLKMGLSKVGDFVKWIIEGLKSTFKSGAMRQILVNVGIVSGIGTGVEYLKDVVKTKKETAKLDKEKQKEEEESLEDLGVALADKEVDMSPLLKVT